MNQNMGECPICKKNLLKGEDIVTCPDCGAKYHRGCYAQKGQCAFSALHAPGFEYAPKKQQQETTPKAKNQGGVLCPNCQTVNDAKNVFCENCGQPLHTNARTQAQGGPPPKMPTFFAPYTAGANWGFAGQNSTAEISGVPVQEWAEFVGSSAPVYLPRLAAIEKQNRKTSFMFSAFFISPIFFANRKMWGWAATSLVASLVFFVPQLFVIAAAQGMALPFNLPTLTLEIMASVANYLDLVMKLGFGFFSLYLYKNFAIKKMAQIRKQNSNDEAYHIALVKLGGTSQLGAALIIGVIFASSMVAYYFMGDALQAYFYPNMFG